MKKNPVVFLDRDGTILNERGYLRDERKMKFYPSSFLGLRRLERHGFTLVVVSNQSGVGRGYFTRGDLNRMNAHFQKKMKNNGITIAGIYYCPHRSDEHCFCRKPKPGLIRRALNDLKLDIHRAFMVGDQERDMTLARVCKMKGVLVLTGAGRSLSSASRRKASFVSSNLTTASRWIIREDNKRRRDDR